jgi:hypothetical protein
MDQPVKSSNKIAIVLGFLTAALGLVIALPSLGLIAPPTKAGSDGERWIALLMGLVFVLGGIAVVIQSSVGNARAPNGGLPRGSPIWMRRAMHFLGFAIVASMAVIFSWIAFGSGPREFGGTFFFLPEWINELTGRLAFGIGAGLIWIILAVMTISGARQLFKRQ